MSSMRAQDVALDIVEQLAEVDELYQITPYDSAGREYIVDYDDGSETPPAFKVVVTPYPTLGEQLNSN